jgi:choline kinase
VKAILLCAGRGSRLDPLTADKPKCLVEVGGAAILDHQIAALHACGIHEVVIVAGYRCDSIKEHVARHPAESGIDVTYNPRWATSNSIGSVWAAKSHLRNPFILVNGDTIFSPELLRKAMRSVETGVNLLIERAAAAGDDMRVTLRDGRLAAVGKHIENAAFRSLGIIVSTGGERYLGALANVLEAPDGDQSYHHAVIDRLAQHTAVNPVAVTGMHWQEIDRVSDIALWNGHRERYAA